MKLLRISLFFMLLALILAGCGGKSKKTATTRVTVSILPLKYFAERIGGKYFEVNVLVPPGSGPETWEPSPGDMAALSGSSLFFYTGYLEFEVMLAGKIANQPSTAIDLSKGVSLIQSHENESESHEGHVHIQGVDPHYWVSPKEARVIASHVRDAFINIMPTEKQTFDQNYQALMTDIDSLDLYIHKRLDAKKLRTFVIYHPSMGYYARDYKLLQLGLESEGKQPSTQHMRELVDIARRDGIKQIFVQKQFDRNITASLAGEIDAELITLDHLSPDWLNNMYYMTDLIDKALNE